MAMPLSSNLAIYGFRADATVPPVLYSALISTYGYAMWTVPASDLPGSFRITVGGTTLRIPLPTWGYAVDYHMPIHVTRAASGEPRMWDDGSTYDYRVCRLTIQGDTIAARAYPVDVIYALFDELKYAFRGETITIDLGTHPTGFYPSGPDKGDVGTFTARILSAKPSGWRRAPWSYADIELEMVILSTPSYSLPSAVSEGSLQIGSISGLRWPDPGFAPTTEYGYSHVLTRSGAPQIMDMGKRRDRWETSFSLPVNQPNAGQLAAYLVAQRGADTTIIADENNHPFGTETDVQWGGSFLGAGQWVANLTNGNQNDTVISWNHVRHNQWDVKLQYWMKRMVPYGS